MILILDIDSTLANIDHRLPLIDKAKPTSKDWDAFFVPELVILDKPIQKTQLIYKKIKNYFDKTLFLTGRPETLRDATVVWLDEYYNISPNKDELFMRSRGVSDTEDHQPRAKFKSRIFQEKILPQYPKQNFMFIDDDVVILKALADFGIVIKAPECWDILF